MSEHFLRGHLLFQQQRYAEAERELRQAVIENPQDADHHALLAVTFVEQQKFDEAEQEAREALRCGPDQAYSHYVMSRVLFARNRLKEAEAAISESLRIDPQSADAYGVQALIRFNRRDYAGALSAANRGLSYDATHIGCSTARTLSLVQLGNSGGALDETAAALRRNPDDDLAHTGRGWALLHAGKPKEALPAFREALRLDATNAMARSGMIEALKARYWLYRLMLRWLLWMSRLPVRLQFALILGLVVVHQVFGRLAREDSPFAIVFDGLFFSVAAFVLFTMMAQPLFNLVLMTSRFGRQVLERGEKIQGAMVGFWLAAILAALATYFLTKPFISEIAAMTGVTFAITVLPLTTAMKVIAWPRRVLIALMAAMFAVAGIAVSEFIAAEITADEAENIWQQASEEKNATQRQLFKLHADGKITQMKSEVQSAIRTFQMMTYLGFGSLVLCNWLVMVRVKR